MVEKLLALNKATFEEMQLRRPTSSEKGQCLLYLFFSFTFVVVVSACSFLYILLTLLKKIVVVVVVVFDTIV